MRIRGACPVVALAVALTAGACSYRDAFVNTNTTVTSGEWQIETQADVVTGKSISEAALPGRFESPDGHRPDFGGSPEAVLSRQALERWPALKAISTLAIDVDGLTRDEVVARVVEALR